jgi:hypothetical protein
VEVFSEWVLVGRDENRNPTNAAIEEQLDEKRTLSSELDGWREGFLYIEVLATHPTKNRLRILNRFTF